MIVKREKLFFKRGYELKPITEEEAENLEIDTQLYAKINKIAYPIRIMNCFENAKKFDVWIIK